MKNEIHCKFMLALGNIGLGNKDKGLAFLSEVEKMDPNHMGILATKTI